MSWILFAISAAALIAVSGSLPGTLLPLICAAVGGYMVGHMGVELDKRDRE